MSFIGKVYKYEKEENFSAFLEQLGISEQLRTFLTNWKPTTQLVDNGNGSYSLKILTADRDRSFTFKGGEEFVEDVGDGKKSKTTVTLVGNVLTQTQKIDDGRVIVYTREFGDSELKQSITVTGWNGTAYRYYKA